VEDPLGDAGMNANGTERFDYHGGRRLTVPGVGLVEVMNDGEVRTLEPLSPTQYERLALWIQSEWPQRKEGYGGY
jgi:hypothetical protein